MELIEAAARAGDGPPHISADTLDELEALHVLRDDGGRIRLTTGVFLQDDVERIIEAVGPKTEELAGGIASAGADLTYAGPELRVFLGGIIGIEGPSRSAADTARQCAPGCYPQTKVDFIERCPAFTRLGPDVLNRSVIHGERYTAVFIGPTGHAFKTFTYEIKTGEASERYRRSLNRFLTDSYARLITGKLKNMDLLATAEATNLRRNGQWRSAVVSNEVYDTYQSAVHRIAATAADWYEDHLPAFRKLLAATASGRQGVPPPAMMMNLWRIVRMITARRLYAAGFFTDDIIREGTLTVFYANNVRPLRDALG